MGHVRLAPGIFGSAARLRLGAVLSLPAPSNLPAHAGGSMSVALSLRLGGMQDQVLASHGDERSGWRVELSAELGTRSQVL